MSNINALEGIRCPKCGSESPFSIEVYAIALVYDDGVEDIGDMEWGPDYGIRCYSCGEQGLVHEFSHRENEEES